ncbi:MAG: TonB family protein [Pseudomonadota bacterium]
MSSMAYDLVPSESEAARAASRAAAPKAGGAVFDAPGAVQRAAHWYRPSNLAALLLVIALHLALIAWLDAALERTEPPISAPAMLGVLVTPPPPPSAPPRQQIATASVPPRPATPPPVERPVSKSATNAVIEPKPVIKPKPQPKPVAKPASAAETESELAPAPTKAMPAAPAPVAQSEAAPPQLIPPRIDAAHFDNPAPIYPSLSRRLGEQGEVLLDVYILPDGAVGEIKLKASSGYARLDAAASEAVQRWRYVPASRGGEPIAYWYVQPVAFRLGK